jgi:hypothetical protein
MTRPRRTLEAPPPGPEGRLERRWALLSLAVLGLALPAAGLVAWRIARVPPPPADPVDHGELPAAVRAEVLRLVAPHLEGARLTEVRTQALREFHLEGRPRPLLAREFQAAFRPLVAGRIMPLLRPYGELLSFDVTALDLPPARLRPLPTKD